MKKNPNPILEAHLKTALHIIPHNNKFDPSGRNEDDWDEYDEESGVYPASYYEQYEKVDKELSYRPSFIEHITNKVKEALSL